MKKIINIFCLALIMTVLAGCEKDFLERSVKTQPTIENVLYNGTAGLKPNGMAAYAYIREWTSLGSNAMLASACDESDFANRSANIQRFNTGGWNQFSNPDEVMTNYYRGIVQTFNFLKNSENFKNLLAIDTLTSGTKEIYLRDCDDIYKLRAENHFLRAYFYFELVRRYGGVPILTEPLDVSTTNLPPRNTVEECFKYILSELDVAYPNMVDYWLNYNIPNGANSVIGSGRGGVTGSTDVTKLGRAEKVAVKALKLRVLLYAASPLFNPANDKAKWEAAAAAGNDFLNDVSLDAWRSLLTSYNELFYSTKTDYLTSRYGSKSGIIFSIAAPSYNTNQFEKWNYPIGIPNGGTAITAPSQNLVDAYEMKATGLPIADPASGYDASNPYTGRDPRLSYTVAVNGEVFGKDVGGVDHKIQAYVGGLDAIGIKEGATTTGYHLKKMIATNFDLSAATVAKRSFVLMRYAEVLLNFAEAMNEAYGPTAKPTINGVVAKYSALEAVNLVRARVTMPALPAGISQADLKTRIQNERRVELAFEEHRFFDVRRWKIAEITENMPLMGIRVVPKDATNTSFTYEKFEVEPRTFDKNKMYLYPIPEAQVIINGWQQNPGW
jgi:hypothetical protein